MHYYKQRLKKLISHPAFKLGITVATIILRALLCTYPVLFSAIPQLVWV